MTLTSCFFECDIDCGKAIGFVSKYQLQLGDNASRLENWASRLPPQAGEPISDQVGDDQPIPGIDVFAFSVSYFYPFLLYVSCAG